MRSPLEGLLVLALEQAVAAPYCSSRLADAGARVIKVERTEGDFARAYDRSIGDLSSYFVWLNRGKQSLVADIKALADAALLHRVLARTDIFIQNLAPGAAERAGFGAEALRRVNPRLITMDISGYGDTPTYQSMKAYDLLVQAESGLASITGHPAGPGRVGVSIVDVGCGMSAHAAILEALIERSITGEGKQLSTSLFAATADWMTVPLLYTESTGAPPERLGLAHPSLSPYGAFPLVDGSLVLISIQNEREWARFCTIFMHEPELPTMPGFESNVARVRNRAAVDARVGACFAKLDREMARSKLLDSNTEFGFVNDVPALASHPALRRTTIETEYGPARIACPPVSAAGETVTLGPVPGIGEHSSRIRQDFSAAA